MKTTDQYRKVVDFQTVILYICISIVISIIWGLTVRYLQGDSDRDPEPDVEWSLSAKVSK